MESHAARAKGLFQKGYNCAQSLLLAFASDVGLDERTASALSSSFGGGMGRLREVCGALTASFMVLGLVYGGYPPGDDAAKAEHYRRIQEMAAAFREANGALLCRELLGRPSGPDRYVPDARTAEYYAKRPCADIIARAAEALANYLDTHPPFNHSKNQ